MAIFPIMETVRTRTHNSILISKFSSSIFFLCLLLFPLLSFGSIRFTNVTSKYQVKGYSYFGGHGANWVDVNKDKLLDLYVKNVGAQGVLAVKNILYINYGGYFLDEADLRGVADGYAIGTHGAIFADFDKDEDFDLFSTTTYDGISPAHNHIYKNDGMGYFLDVTSGIIPSQNIDTASRGTAVGDFDGDGDLDLFFSNPLPDPLYFNPEPSPARQLQNFYINEGGGVFTPMYRGIDWTGFTQGVSCVDVDGDGDLDIAEAKWGAPSTIYRNDGKGNFTDVGKVMGLPQTSNVSDNGMIFADIDNDGDMDLTVAGKRALVLYKNKSNKFISSQTINTFKSFEGFHVSFGDFDHDGDLDLYYSGENVYENDGNGLFSLIMSSASGLTSSVNTSDARGSALGDFDNDGDLDIYVTDKKGYNLLFRNEVNDSNWIQVEIISDHTKGIGGLGAKLDLYTAGFLNKSNYLKGHREIQGEYGYLGQDMPLVHFGAPSSAKYDLKVTFLDGSQEIVSNLTPGQVIQVPNIPPPPDPPVNLDIAVSVKSLMRSPVITYLLSWEKNPDNKTEDIKEYIVYRKEAGGEFSPVLTVANSVFSAEIAVTARDRRYHYAVSTVSIYDVESDIVPFSFQD